MFSTPRPLSTAVTREHPKDNPSNCRLYSRCWLLAFDLVDNISDKDLLKEYSKWPSVVKAGVERDEVTLKSGGKGVVRFSEAKYYLEAAKIRQRQCIGGQELSQEYFDATEQWQTDLTYQKGASYALIGINLREPSFLLKDSINSRYVREGAFSTFPIIFNGDEMLMWIRG